MGGGAGVSEFFFYEPKFKIIYFFFFLRGKSLELDQVIFIYKKSKSKKKIVFWGGGRGWGEGARDSNFLFN